LIEQLCVHKKTSRNNGIHVQSVDTVKMIKDYIVCVTEQRCGCRQRQHNRLHIGTRSGVFSRPRSLSSKDRLLSAKYIWSLTNGLFT